MDWLFGNDSTKTLKAEGSEAPPGEEDPGEEEPPVAASRPAVTSLAPLGGGRFLAAAGPGVGLHRLAEGDGTELLREFAGGHRCDVEALAVLCGKGRFLTSGRDGTVRLWDSRFDCDDAAGGDDDDDDAGLPRPRTHLATFDCFPRWVHSIAVLDAGKFVRPEGDMDMAMFAAGMKKAALEGSAALARAARQMDIIKCTGTFATASRNEKQVRVWELSATADGDAEEGNGPGADAAALNQAHVLEHDHAVTALASAGKRLFLGDATGVVALWERKEGLLASLTGRGGDWAPVRRLTPWKPGALVPPEDQLAQAIATLCPFGDALAAGGRSGVVRVWDALGDLEGFEAHKKEFASSVKVGPMAGIAALPDGDGGEARRALAVAGPGGRVARLGLRPREGSAKPDLVMLRADALPGAAASLAVCDAGDGSRRVLLAGDVDGRIHALELGEGA